MRYLFLLIICCIGVRVKAQHAFDQLQAKYNTYKSSGQTDSALHVASRMQAWVLINESDTSLNYPIALRYMATCLRDERKYDSSIQVFQRALSVLKKQDRATHREYTSSLSGLSIAYKKTGEFRKAETCLLKAIDIRTKYPTLQGDKPKYLNNLGYLYISMGLYDEAEEKINMSLDRLKQLYNVDSSKYYKAIHSLAKVKFSKGEYKEADINYQSWFRIAMQQQSGSPELLEGLNDIAENAIMLKAFDRAFEYLQLAESIYAKNPKCKKWHEFILFNDVLGQFYGQKNELNKSIEYYRTSINVLDALEKPDSSGYAITYQGMSEVYYKFEKLDSATIYAHKSIAIQKEIVGPMHPEYVLSLRKMASIQSASSQYRESLRLLMEALRTYKSIFSKNHKLIADVNNAIGINYRKLGLYQSANHHFNQAYDIHVKNNNVLGQANLKNNLGYLKIYMGDYDSAKIYVEDALRMQKEHFKNDSTRFYSTVHSLGRVYHEQDQYRKADTLYKQWWNVIRKLEQRTEQKCTGLFDLVKNAMKNNDSRTAKKYLNIADSIISSSQELKKSVTGAFIHKLFGDMSFSAREYDTAHKNYLFSSGLFNQLNLVKTNEYAEVMLAISKFHLRGSKSDYQEAIRFALQALAIQKEALGEQHPDYATTLNDLGILYNGIDSFDVSLAYHRQALQIREAALGPYSLDYAQSLNNLAVSYSSLGQYDKVLTLYEKVLEITKALPNPSISLQYTAYSNLSNSHKRNGDLQKAEWYLREGLQLLNSRENKKEDRMMARCYGSFGDLYLDVGDYVMAQTYFQKAFNIYESDSGSMEPLAKIRSNMGKLYIAMGDFKQAYEHLVKSMYLYASIKGKGVLSLDYAVSLNELGRYFMAIHNYDSAAYYFNQSLAIRKDKYPKGHPLIARSYKNLGDVQAFQRNYTAAETLYKQACKINQAFYGEKSLNELIVMNALASMYVTSGVYEKAFPLLNEAYAYKTKEIIDNFDWLNDNNKELYWDKENIFFNNLLWYGDQMHNQIPAITELAYNTALFSKSKLLETKIAEERHYIELEALRDDLFAKRRRIAKLESEGMGNEQNLKREHEQLDSLDRVLVAKWPEYGQQKQNLSITWQQVRQHLDVDEAAIEFVRYRNGKDSAYYYYALLIRKTDDRPIHIPLFPEKSIVAIKPTEGFSAYYELIWKPIDPYLQEIGTVYYAPVGELNQIPFHAIYAPRNGGDALLDQLVDQRGIGIDVHSAITEDSALYLFDRYTMHQLLSTRYLAMGLKNKLSEPIGNTIAIVGGINYDFLPTEDQPAFTSTKKNKSAVRSIASANQRLVELEGTKQETQRIRDTVQSQQWKIEYFSKNEATEENITRLEGKHAKSILHIATHGYAFPRAQQTSISDSILSTRFSHRYNVNPMVRSGLILTGGNWAWVGSDTLSKLGAEQNGILTALEVSELNLRKTKLVVLSACETGLGENDQNEGTFGLKRGFKLAGVEQLVVSLWPVPDLETMELMTLFYSDLSKTHNPVISFENAQKTMRYKYPNEPVKWAGFVLVR